MSRSTADSCATTKAIMGRGVGEETKAALRDTVHTAFSMRSAMLINGTRTRLGEGISIANQQQINSISNAMQYTGYRRQRAFHNVGGRQGMIYVQHDESGVPVNGLWLRWSVERLALRAAGTTNHVCLAEVEARGSQNFCTRTTSYCYPVCPDLSLLATRALNSLALHSFKADTVPIVSRRMHPVPPAVIPAQPPRRMSELFHDDAHTHIPAQC
jgi:hypothetical protein